MSLVRTRLLLLPCCVLLNLPARAQRVEPDRKETRDLVAFVTRAAGVVHAKGPAAFAEFRKKGGEWLKGDQYLFVLDSRGKTLCNAGHPEVEGQMVQARRDDRHRPFGAHMLEALSGHDDAWVYYRFQRPGEKEYRWKASYLVRAKGPDGKAYLVGSGAYEPKLDRAFVADTVDRAVEMIQQRGPSAISTLRDQNGRFRFMDAYVFILDEQGKMLVHGATPSLENKNQIDLKDKNGKAIIREFIKVAEGPGSGWVDYVWPKPGADQPSPKSSYIRRAKLHGKLVAVGCGLYRD